MAAKSRSAQVVDFTAKRIVFFHPDLGIGGAERLIVDAAVGLQELGHKVTIFTSHCDPQHCFEEARDGTLDVRVRGNTIFPATILNRFHILLAILRQIHLIFAIDILSGELHDLDPEIFIVDQLSACIPFLRFLYARRQRILFYCHFPDQLLADRKGGMTGVIKSIYRIPFDWFEGWSMGGSDRIVVNSNFTKVVASQTFSMGLDTFGVIYPCVDAPLLAEKVTKERLWNDKFRIILSINRFERKKNIGLAIHAYNALPPLDRKSSRLILAGGYDNRVTENVQYHQELVELAESLGLTTATAKTVPTALGIPDNIDVLFLLSVPGPFKTTLLQNARLLVYTPSNEHFGIVPVEAMQYGVPVLASNTGGPLETIVEGKTGWLRSASRPEEWTAVMKLILTKMTSEEMKTMAKAGQQRVQERFTRPTMARKFDNEINGMLNQERSNFVRRLVLSLMCYALILSIMLWTVLRYILSQWNTTGQSTSHFARASRTHPGDAQQIKFYSTEVR